KSVLSFLAKASTDETPISVLSIQGRSKVSDEIRSNMSEDDVSVIGIIKMMISACQSAYYFYVSSSICGRVKRKSSERFSTRKKSHVKNPHMAF
ncbi:hypothetical protein MXE40_12250, partial [Anaerobiospirillum sp. NML02-A-032]|uniref:hypothetical protein n=1 Tax=Anaerobiospirillum sp. NML02-A-032 TaxID=2932818 RepID=UPI001FF520E3